jgi:hypothetical protein
MASSKRPPLELDDLTNNLKQSSGKGVDAFFSAPPPPQEKKKPAIQEEQAKAVQPANVQIRTSGKLSRALSDSEKVEKYTTHVEPSLVKKIQIEAIEKDINDYDVVRVALKEYFERNINESSL